MGTSASEFLAVDLQEQPTMETSKDSGAARPSTSQDAPKNAKEIMSDLFGQFHNFDDPGTYQSYMTQATGEKTANFAIRFGVEKAEIAINLEEQDLGALLQVQAENKDDKIVCTWINIWSPLANIGIVKAIASKYKFSTRLQGTIIGWDEARRQVAERLPKKPTHKASGPVDVVNPRPRSRRTFLVRPSDPEKGITDDGEATRRATVAKALGLDTLHQEDLHMYRLLQEQYNYTTIDHGPNFICIGANWLHHRSRPEKMPHEAEDIYKDSVDIVPPKHWAWYILTNEGTVISIHEAPNYENPKKKDVDLQEWRTEELKNMRKNTLDLLYQLSTPGMDHYRHRVSSQKGVRSDLLKTIHRGPLPTARTTVLESSLAVDASANLFFYLFEDYTAATSILSTSNDVLAKLTEDVLHITDRKNKDKDSSNIIRLLYARSKDLRQLKHLFESYEKLIKGIMDLGIDTAGEDKDPFALASSTGNLAGGGVGPARGVKLSQKAFDRFDRLGIRMRLLMLDTIDEYLAEKASLSDTYFNLMSQKDSQATSKLNRSASLLAKLSVFFLPISFMTSYFSVQIPDLTNNYTGTTYWVAFAVVATLSFMSLFFFSRMLMVVSDVLDEKVHHFQKSVARCIGRLFSGTAKKVEHDGEGGGGYDGGGKSLEED